MDRSADPSRSADGSGRAGAAPQRSAVLSAKGGAATAWHVITPEYPPRVGGVADFTRVVAHGLSAQGATVHVWSPRPADADDRVTVHAIDGVFPVSTLSALDRALDEIAGARRLFVQWVPHGYGYKSLNVPFCRWVAQRARRGDELDVMVHEPFLPFDVTRVRQNIGAVVHRVMLSVLLGAADRVWVSTPSFVPEIRRFARRRSIPFNWLPVPSPIETIEPSGIGADDASGSGLRIGYFGAANPLVASLLEATILDIVARRPDVRVVLAGTGTDSFAEAIRRRHPAADSRVTALGQRSPAEVSRMIQSCDVFVQPYPDGASARRTTLMALLQHGRAIVTNCGPRTESWWRDSAAVALHPAAPATLAGAVASLLDSPAARADLGARARTMYATRFDASHTVAALLAATT